MPAREILEGHIRALTLIFADDGREHNMEWLRSQVNLVHEVNGSTPLQLRIETPLLPWEEADIRRQIEVHNRTQSRSEWAHIIIDHFLLDWLIRATGSSREDLIQRLAIESSNLMDRLDGSSGSP